MHPIASYSSMIIYVSMSRGGCDSWVTKQKDRGIQVTQKTKDSRFAIKDTILTLKWRLRTLCFPVVTVSPRHFGVTIITYFTFCWA